MKICILLLALAALPAAAQLRITEVCPQPATEHPSTHEVIDALDPNGKVSGWIEFKFIRSVPEGSVELMMGEAIAAFERE